MRGTRVPSLLLSSARVCICPHSATTFLIQMLHGSCNGVSMHSDVMDLHARLAVERERDATANMGLGLYLL
jgi:hypothetical protein